MTRAQAEPVYDDADDGQDDELDYDEAEEPELRRSPWAVAALVLGIIAALAPLGNAFGIVAILAIITGHSARRDAKRGIASGKTMAAWGLGLAYFSLAAMFLANMMNS